MNANTTKQEDIERVLWRACDTFRGVVDASNYKSYILVMLFVKFVSDVWQERYEELKDQYKGDDERIRRRLDRERFVLPKGCSFIDLYNAREKSNIGEIINTALVQIEDANRQKIQGVFRNIDFNSEPNLGQTRERNVRLKHLLEDFNDPALNLRPSKIGNMDVIGDAYLSRKTISSSC